MAPKKTDEKPRQNIGPRFLNASEGASGTIAEISTSTSSTISIPVSVDPSLIATPKSRIATSADGNQEQGNNQQEGAPPSPVGIAIAPEGATTGEDTASGSSATISLSASPFVTHQKEAASSLHENQPTTAKTAQAQTGVPIPRLPAPFSSGPSSGSLETVSQSDTPSSGAGGASSNRVNDAPASAFHSTNPSASVSSAATTEDALDAFQSARSKQATATAAVTSISGATTQPASTSNDEKSPSTGIATTQTTAAPNNNVLPNQASRFFNGAHSTDASADIQNSSSDQASSQPSRTQTITTSSAVSNPSSTVQVPSSLLGDANISGSGFGSSPPTQSSSATPPKYAYPDASNGYAAMAQGYNKVFQSLNPLSKCDPADSKQASACVDGQPASCELDGTYTLQSCDQGQSCYAVPKPDGQSGLTIACFTPGEANKAVADGVAATSSKGGNFVDAQKVTFQSSTTIAKSTLDTEASTNPSRTIDATSRGISSSAGSAPSISVPLGAEADTQPSQSIEGSSGSANTKSSTPTSQFAATTTDPVQDHKQALRPGKDQLETQKASLPSPSPTSQAGGAVGVQLSFPGGNGSEAGSKAGKQPQPPESAVASPATPPLAQKNAVHLDQQQPVAQSSAMPSSQSHTDGAATQILPPDTALSSTSAANTPGVTVAPMLGAGNQNGFVTVTVTQTTVIHDRG